MVTRDLKSVPQLAEVTPFSEAQLRWWIFNEKSNGLSDRKAIVRIGRRVYVDVGRFYEWIDSINASGSPEVLEHGR